VPIRTFFIPSLLLKGINVKRFSKSLLVVADDLDVADDTVGGRGLEAEELIGVSETGKVDAEVASLIDLSSNDGITRVRVEEVVVHVLLVDLDAAELVLD
jgi:hypothetical protein